MPNPIPPCTCGKGPACAVGDVCKGGACLCDPGSCAGCCDKQKDLCQAVSWPAACGAKGDTCTPCG